MLAKLDPAKVFVRGELWNAEADGEIDMGEKVEIVGYQGLNLKVRRLINSVVLNGMRRPLCSG